MPQGARAWHKVKVLPCPCSVPKFYVKSTNFSSIARINVGSFSMRFGCKIIYGSGVTSCQN